MSNVGYGTLQIIPSAKGFKALLDKEVSTPMKGVGDKEGKAAGGKFRSGILGSLKGLAGPMAALIGGGALISFFKDSVGAASDLSESTSKVGVVFKTSAKQIMEASKTSAQGMGLSQQAYLEATGTLGNLLVSLEITPKKAADMSQQMVKLAGDLASFNNASPADTLDALRAGLTGEAEPLKRFGINMNATTLAAEALKLGLIKNVKEALTPQNKALAAQSLIMTQTKTAQGDFARTSGGLANQQRILAARMEDVKAKVGKALLPIITKLVTFVNTSVIPAISGFVSGMQDGSGAGGKFVEAFKTIVSTFQTKVLPVLKSIGQVILTNVVPAVKGFVTAFAPLVISAAKLAVSIGSKLLPPAVALGKLLAGSLLSSFKAIGGFVGDNATLFQSLAVGIGAGLAVWKAWQLAMATGAVVMKGIAAVTRAYAVAQGILNAVMALNPILLVVIALIAIGAALVYAYTHSEKFRAIVDGAFRAVQAAASFAWNWIKSNWPLLLAIVTGPIGLAVLLIVKNFDTIKAAAGKVLSAITGAFSAVVGFFAGLPGKILSALSTAATFLISKGRDFIVGLGKGIYGAAVAVFTWWNKLPGVIAGKIGSVASTLAGKGRDLLGGLHTAAVTAAGNIYTFFSELPGKIVSKLGNLGSTLSSAGKDLARGFINGIGDMVGDAAAKAKELASAAKNAITGFLGINSPSKVLHQIGIWTGQGLANGMRAQLRNVSGAGDSLAEAAISRQRAFRPIRSATAFTSRPGSAPDNAPRPINVNVYADDPNATARTVGRYLANQGV